MGTNVSKRGRPFAGDFSDPVTGEFNDDGLTIVRRASGMGLTMAETAALLGMNVATFSERRKAFPDIDDVIALGDAEAGVRVASALLRRAEQGDMSAIRWYETTRKGRAEKVEQTVEHVQYVVEVPAQQSEEAWEKMHSPVGLPLDDGSITPI